MGRLYCHPGGQRVGASTRPRVAQMELRLGTRQPAAGVPFISLTVPAIPPEALLAVLFLVWDRPPFSSPSGLPLS